MSRSICDARQIGALFVLFLAFVFFSIFVSLERASAAPAYFEEPLFAQCGLEGLGHAGVKDRIAARTQREGRSAIAFDHWRSAISPIAPGLLAFNVRSDVWPNAPARAAADPQARFCPSGAKL